MIQFFLTCVEMEDICKNTKCGFFCLLGQRVNFQLLYLLTLEIFCIKMHCFYNHKTF